MRSGVSSRSTWQTQLGGAGQLAPGVTRRKASRSSRGGTRKGTARGGLDPAGQRSRCKPRGACVERAAPTALEPAEWCLRRRQGTSDTGDVNGKGCSSPLGASGPPLGSTARCWSSECSSEDVVTSAKASGTDRWVVDASVRSWPKRIAGPFSRGLTARTESGHRRGRSLRRERCTTCVTRVERRRSRGPRVRS